MGQLSHYWTVVTLCIVYCVFLRYTDIYGKDSAAIMKSPMEWLEIAMNLTRDNCVDYKPLRGTFLDTTNYAFSVEYVLLLLCFIFPCKLVLTCRSL